MAEEYVKQADELHEKPSPNELFELLNKAQQEFPNNAEILWR